MIGLRAALATALVVTLASACSSGGSGPREGHDFHAGSFGGVPGLDNVYAGEHVGVAFPLIKNETSRPITIDRISLDHLPAGLRVTGYRAISLRYGYIVLSRENKGGKDDFLTYPNLVHQGRLQIAPHSIGHVFFAVDLVARKKNPGKASGCTIHYKVNGVRYFQTFHCAYNFTGHLLRP